MAVLTPTPKQQIFGSDGTPLVGGKIFTYAAGTSTPIATYTDYSAGTANTNPIILDSLGQANIWLLTNTGYKFIVKTATDVLLYTVDNIVTPIDITAFASPPPIGDVAPNTGAFTTLTASGAVTFTGTGATKINAGTTAQRPTPTNGMIRYNTTTAAMEGYINGAWTSLALNDGTIVTLTGTQTLTNKTIEGGAITSGTAVASTSGTSIDFTSIPSWVKRITVMFAGVSISGTSSLRIQIGAGSVETSGYVGTSSIIAGSSAASSITGSAGFDLIASSPSASALATGSVVLLSFGSNQWIASGWVGYDVATTQSESINGRKTTSSTLDRIRITTVNGTDTFDAGSINILYEG